MSIQKIMYMQGEFGVAYSGVFRGMGDFWLRFSWLEDSNGKTWQGMNIEVM